MPTTTKLDNAPESLFLSAVRESQAAVIDVIRAWSDIGQQLTRNLGLPVAAVDVAGAVDRVFDVAEQTLAHQRQLALTLTGVATHQVGIAVDTVVEQPQAEPPTQDRRPDGRTYEERSVEELRERAADLQIEGRSSMTKEELIAALRERRQSRSARNGEPRQDRTPDRRAYEERSVEELRERARELEIEGRSTMSKEELIAALRERTK